MVLIWGDSTLKTSYRGPCFRPLTGIMVLIKSLKIMCWHYKASFRPLTGIIVLIVVDVAEDLKYDIIEFPSPYGDYGSYLCF